MRCNQKILLNLYSLNQKTLKLLNYNKYGTNFILCSENYLLEFHIVGIKMHMNKAILTARRI